MNEDGECRRPPIIRLPRGTHWQRRVFNVSKQRLLPEAPISNQSAFRQPVVSQTSLLLRGFEGEVIGSPIVLLSSTSKVHAWFSGVSRWMPTTYSSPSRRQYLTTPENCSWCHLIFSFAPTLIASETRMHAPERDVSSITAKSRRQTPG